MCLYSESKDPKVAAEDIPVFKVLVKVGKEYSAPYQNFIYEPNKLYEDTSEEHIQELFGFYEVSQGYFHACLNEESASDLAKEYARCLRMRQVKYPIEIFNAIIPKGSSYYVGQRCDICSRSIIIKDVIANY